MKPYRILLALLPSDFRRRHGAEMEAVMAGQLAHAAERGPLSKSWVWLRALIDVVVLAGRLRRTRTGRRGEMMGTALGQVIGDLGAAVRGLRRTPTFFLAAAGTIALGVGATTGVFSVVNGVVLEPLPYPDAERLVVVYNRYPTLDVERASQSPGDLDDYRAQADLLEETGSVSTFPQTLVEDGRPRRVQVAVVTSGFFGLLGVTPALGRDLRPDDDHDVVIISHAYWVDEMGSDPEVLGGALPFAGLPKTIIGVLPQDFRLVVPPNFGVPEAPELWTHIPAQGWGRDSGDRTAHWMNIVGRMRADATLEQVREQMASVAARQRELLPHRAEREAEVLVAPLHAEVVRDVQPALVALLAAAAIVLLIACANVSSLLLVRAQRRRVEVAIRTAMGAGRARILSQMLSEGFILGVVGAAVGLGIAWMGATLFLRLEPGGLPKGEDVSMDVGVLLFVAAVTGGATLLFSLAPAWFSTHSDLASAMRGAGRSSPTRRGNTLSSTLIVAELALSLVLLVGGGLLVRSFVALVDVDPGYQTEGMLTFKAPLPASAFRVDPPPGYTGRPDFNFVRKPYYDDLTRALGELPGVRAVGGVFPAPLSGELSTSTFATEATSEQEESRLASSQLVTPEYFETVGIEFVEGRTFLPEEIGDKLVIDQAMAETVWPGESALGKRLEIGWWSGPVWGEVVGVVENVRSHGLTERNPPTVYRLGTVYAYGAMTMVLRVEGDPLATVDAVRSAVAGINQAVPVIDVRTMSENVADQSARTRFVLALGGVFGAGALDLAAVGLYGVISYAVGQRLREYGIRLAFGAGRGQVFALVLRRGLALTALGVLVGLGVALAVRRYVEPFLFDVDPGDPLTLVAIVGLVAFVALTACSGPAGRATLVDPVESLRSE